MRLELTILAEINASIATLNLPFLSERKEEVGEEINELKFGIAVMAFATEENNNLPEEFLVRSIARVLQLLNNQNMVFENKNLLKHHIMRAYQLFRKEGMDFGSDVQYAKPYNKPLFHLKKNVLVYKTLQNTGFSDYFLNPNLKFIQRIVNRLNYFFANFGFPPEWINGVNLCLLHPEPDQGYILKPILDVVWDFARTSDLNEDKRIQFLALSYLVISESNPETLSSKAEICYYSNPEIRSLLVSIAAERPAPLIIEKFKKFSDSLNQDSIQRRFCESFLQQPEISKIKILNIRPIKSGLYQSVHALVVAIRAFAIVEKDYQNFADEIESALKRNEVSIALILAIHFRNKYLTSIEANPDLSPVVSFISEKYNDFFLVDGECYLRPKTLNPDFSIPLISLASGPQEFEKIISSIETNMRLFDVRAGKDILNSTFPQQVNFYRLGKSHEDAFLKITFSSEENQISIELDLHFLTSVQINTLILLVIGALTHLKSSETTSGKAIAAIANLKEALEMHYLVNLERLQTMREESQVPMRVVAPSPAESALDKSAVQSTPEKPALAAPPSIDTPEVAPLLVRRHSRSGSITRASSPSLFPQNPAALDTPSCSEMPLIKEDEEENADLTNN